MLKFDNSYAALGDAFYTSLEPDPLTNPKNVILNEDALGLIGLHINSYTDEEFLKLSSGSFLPQGSNPLAMVYAGHQFGGYSPQLGDGRGLLLGQTRNDNGILWDIHLKGAGKTPYSRMGDGRAVLRSSIREFLASEALHGLGIPTTRALSIVTSDEDVWRETIEKATMLIRLSRSHIRFGSFEFFSYTNQYNKLRQLCNYTISEHFPEVSTLENSVDGLLMAATEKTAQLIAKWQAYGFAHGVMNTDNMSIIGQTFDFGPYGFVESYDPNYICNHSDHHGRYAFNQQPNIGYWNCLALANALKILISETALEQMQEIYWTTFNDHYHELMMRKLGLTLTKENDIALYQDLLDLLQSNQIDYNNFFRALSHYKITQGINTLSVLKSCANEFRSWFARYNERLNLERRSDEDRHKRMCAVNPKYILRNYLAQLAIQQSEMGDHSELARLHMVLKNPYGEQPEYEKYADPTPAWGQNLQISCSS